MKQLFVVFLFATALSAQQTPSDIQRWQVTADFYGATRYYRLDLNERDRAHVSATLNGTHLSGMNTDGHLLLTGQQNGNEVKIDAHEDHSTLVGTLTFADTPAPLTYPFKAFLVEP